MVDRFRVVAEIAHGGMAAVYAVQQRGPTGFDKLLAMKVLLPHLAAEPRFIEMFLDEARIAAHLQHPHLVQVFELGSQQGLPYLVMELLKGKSLHQVLARATEVGTPVPTEVLRAVLAATASGLHAAHEATTPDSAPLHVVHRDVSPQNIHVGYDGQVKVVDFGIAAARGRVSTTRTGETKGKLSYVAPEQLDRSHRQDRRVDVWALGVVAWEAFSGRRLFASDTDSSTVWNVLHGPIHSLSQFAPGLAPELCTVIHRCLERNPARRPATCAELAELFALAPPLSGGAAGIRDFVERLFGMDRLEEAARFASLPSSPAAAQMGAPLGPAPASTRVSRRLWLGLGGGLIVGAAALALNAVPYTLPQVAKNSEAVAPLDQTSRPVTRVPSNTTSSSDPPPLVLVEPTSVPPARRVVEPTNKRPSGKARPRAPAESPTAPKGAELAPSPEQPLLRSPY